MTNKMLIGALAEDLYRAANGLHTGAEKMAGVFIKESLQRKGTIDEKSVKPHIKKILTNLPETVHQEDIKRKAEEILMISVILRNYAQSL
jgi:hypothetical protein